MRPETSETRQPLRFGYTTGACATAASLAAARLLLAGAAAALAHGLIDVSYALPDLMLVWVFMFSLAAPVEE